MSFMETLRKLDHRGLNAQCHMAACHSDDISSRGFQHLGTLAWALWTLPLGHGGKRKKELAHGIWSRFAWIPLVFHFSYFGTAFFRVSPKAKISPTGLYSSFFFWPCYGTCRILVPQPGIEPMSPALEAWNLNPWTVWEV